MKKQIDICSVHEILDRRTISPFIFRRIAYSAQWVRIKVLRARQAATSVFQAGLPLWLERRISAPVCRATPVATRTRKGALNVRSVNGDPTKLCAEPHRVALVVREVTQPPQGQRCVANAILVNIKTLREARNATVANLGITVTNQVLRVARSVPLVQLLRTQEAMLAICVLQVGTRMRQARVHARNANPGDIRKSTTRRNASCVAEDNTRVNKEGYPATCVQWARLPQT